MTVLLGYAVGLLIAVLVGGYVGMDAETPEAPATPPPLDLPEWE